MRMEEVKSGEEPLMKRDLFGGAIELHLPSRFMDISDFRPIPDHQEVRSLLISSLKFAVELSRSVKHEHPKLSLQVFADGGEDQSIILEIVVCLSYKKR